LIDKNIFHLKNHEIFFNNRAYRDENSNGGSVTNLIPQKNRNIPLYFKANLISDKNIEIFEKNPIEIFEKYADLPSIKFENFIEPNDYPKLFDDNVKPEMWLLLLQEILEYRKKLNQKLSELVNKGLLSNTEKLTSEYKKWQKDNPNKLESFSNKFNPLLEKLNLQVDLVNTEYSIPILNKRTEETISIQNTSTGTKGLLLTFLPLFKLNTKDSIILIDEPERSLFPDMQMDLMDHYQKLAPEAQFIVATHSPFIAASFEPDERFILYFDEEGKVTVRRGTSPIGDDPNDILKNDFKLESLMNEKGVEAFEKYRDLKKRLATENNEDEKNKLLEEILSLANAYKF
ncbi:MAG: ATP-binding protein, partial [Flavobacterium sp.]